jgi:hypothetical protein
VSLACSIFSEAQGVRDLYGHGWRPGVCYTAPVLSNKISSCCDQSFQAPQHCDASVAEGESSLDMPCFMFVLGMRHPGMLHSC